MDHGGPQFLIVGAPRCATTSMNAWLSVHPELYLAHKELHGFGSDLVFHNPERRSWARYLAAFEQAGAGQVRGEGSVLYLMSESAAEEIHRFNPAMKIIVMLRPPVELIASLHRYAMFAGGECHRDLRRALAAEPHREAHVLELQRQSREARDDPTSRKRRRRRGFYPPHGLLYRRCARFADQVSRYLQHFPAENVKTILVEDLKADGLKVYRDTLHFLGVDASFEPALEVVNSNREVSSLWLQRLVRYPPMPLHRVNKAFFNLKIRLAIEDRLVRMNSRQVKAPPTDPALAQELREEYASEVERLGALIGRDLSHWNQLSAEASRARS